MLSQLVTLDQAFKGDVVVVATDAAGNTSDVTATTFHTTVDVVTPDAPTITSHLTVNPRHCDIDVGIKVPADSAPSGSTLSWDFGYSTSTLLGSAPFDDAAFDNPALTTKVTTISAPGAAGTTTTAHLLGLPALNTIDLAPRVVDSIGNRSAMAFTPHDVLWTVLTEPYTGSYPVPVPQFGAYVAVGDIDKDGSRDIAVSAPAVHSHAAFAGAGSQRLLRLAGRAAGHRQRRLRRPGHL